MIRQLKITSLLTAALLITGCGIMKTSSEMAASDYQPANSSSNCAVSSDCAVAEKIPEAIYFDFGTADLDMNDRELLDTVVEQMGSSRRIELTGYTCNIGDDQVNQYLSERRALAVKAYLTQKGIEEDRITTLGKGKRHSVTTNGKEENRPNSRRVELKILR